MPTPAIIAAAGGLAANFVSNYAQRKENKKTREYNLQLAQMQNQWNVEQWQRENDYNSPTAQLQRLRDAGINPDMVYGGGISNTSTSSPQMTAGSAASPTPLVGMPNVVDNYLDAQLKQAQIDNINANTKKQGAETSILTDEQKFVSSLREGDLKLQNMQLQVADKNMQLSDAQIKESQKRLQQMDANINHINTMIDKVTSDIEVNDATIKKYASECNLNYAQAKSITEQLNKLLRRMDDEHSISVAEHARLSIENGKLDFDARFTGPSSWDSELNVYDNVIRYIRRLFDGIPITGSFGINKAVK